MDGGARSEGIYKQERETERERAGEREREREREREGGEGERERETETETDREKKKLTKIFFLPFFLSFEFDVQNYKERRLPKGGQKRRSHSSKREKISNFKIQV